MNNDLAGSFSSTAVDSHSRRSAAHCLLVTDEYPQAYPQVVHTSGGVPHGFGRVIPKGLWTWRFRFSLPQRRFRRGAGQGRNAGMTRTGGVGAFS